MVGEILIETGRKQCISGNSVQASIEILGFQNDTNTSDIYKQIYDQLMVQNRTVKQDDLKREKQLVVKLRYQNQKYFISRQIKVSEHLKTMKKKVRLRKAMCTKKGKSQDVQKIGRFNRWNMIQETFESIWEKSYNFNKAQYTKQSQYSIKEIKQDILQKQILMIKDSQESCDNDYQIADDRIKNNGNNVVRTSQYSIQQNHAQFRRNTQVIGPNISLFAKFNRQRSQSIQKFLSFFKQKVYFENYTGNFDVRQYILKVFDKERSQYNRRRQLRSLDLPRNNSLEKLKMNRSIQYISNSRADDKDPSTRILENHKQISISTLDSKPQKQTDCSIKEVSYRVISKEKIKESSMMLIDMKTKTMDYNEKLISYIQNQKKDYIKLLLKKNMLELKINYQDKYGMTMMMYACQIGDIWTFKKLLKMQPDLNLQNNNGETCLHLSIENQNFKITDQLYQLGVDETIMNRKGQLANELQIHTIYR